MNYRSRLKMIPIVLLTVAQFLGMGGVVRIDRYICYMTTLRKLICLILMASIDLKSRIF